MKILYATLIFLFISCQPPINSRDYIKKQDSEGDSFEEKEPNYSEFSHNSESKNKTKQYVNSSRDSTNLKNDQINSNFDLHIWNNLPQFKSRTYEIIKDENGLPKSVLNRKNNFEFVIHNNEVGLSKLIERKINSWDSFKLSSKTLKNIFISSFESNSQILVKKNYDCYCIPDAFPFPNDFILIKYALNCGEGEVEGESVNDLFSGDLNLLYNSQGELVYKKFLENDHFLGLSPLGQFLYLSSRDNKIFKIVNIKEDKVIYKSFSYVKSYSYLNNYFSVLLEDENGLFNIVSHNFKGNHLMVKENIVKSSIKKFDINSESIDIAKDSIITRIFIKNFPLKVNLK